MSFEEADLYDCWEESDELRWSDPDEAVESKLDEMDREQWPEEVTVYAWKRMEVERLPRLIDFALQAILDDLDEDYGDPEEATEPTEAMLAAARAFVDAVIAEYTVWRCEPCGQQTVAVLPWVHEHRPDWLGEEE